MIDELRHGIIVADHDALEADDSPEPSLQQLSVHRHRRAGEIDKGGHDRRGSRSNCRRERRQIYLVQRSLRHVGRGVFAAGGHGPIGAKMLGGGGDAVPRREVLSLEAPRLGRRHLRRHPGILARALDDPSPARIARYVEHRRKGQGDPILRRLLRCGARRFLPQVGGKQTGLREGDGKNRVVAVDNIEAQEQGDAETRVFDGKALHGPHLVNAPEIEQISDASGSNPLVQVVTLARAGDRAG
jgi:hypothetical protein